MAQAGLSYTSPLMAGLTPEASRQTPMASMGTGSLIDSEIDSLVASTTPTIMAAPEPMQPAPSKIRFNTATNKLAVGSYVFDPEDAGTAVQTYDALSKNKDLGAPPTDAGWIDLPPESYQAYMDKIVNPSSGRLFSKNFAIGVDTLQLMGGAALQAVGAEGLGSRIVAQQNEDIRRNSPYQREFTDTLEDDGSLTDWFIAALGQAGPSLLETAAVGLAGFAAGTAAAGPAGGALAALGGVVGRGAFKQKALELAKRASETKAAGGKLDDVSQKELSRIAGAVAAGTAVVANNYALGVGEVYNELREKGVDPDDFGARAMAFTAGIPMAAADSVAELFLVSKFFGKGYSGSAPLRIGKGFLVGGAIEGTAEAMQENIVMGSAKAYTGAEYEDWATRTINSFAAGFAPGSVVGAASGMKRSIAAGEGVDLTKGVEEAGKEKAPTPVPVEQEEPYQRPVVQTPVQQGESYFLFQNGEIGDNVQRPPVTETPVQAPAVGSREYLTAGMETPQVREDQYGQQRLEGIGPAFVPGKDMPLFLDGADVTQPLVAEPTQGTLDLDETQLTPADRERFYGQQRLNLRYEPRPNTVPDTPANLISPEGAMAFDFNAPEQGPDTRVVALSKAGTPFTSAAKAKLSAVFKSNPGAKVVPVTGGFGVMYSPTQPTPTPPSSKGAKLKRGATTKQQAQRPVNTPKAAALKRGRNAANQMAIDQTPMAQVGVPAEQAPMEQAAPAPMTQPVVSGPIFEQRLATIVDDVTKGVTPMVAGVLKTMKLAKDSNQLQELFKAVTGNKAKAAAGEVMRRMDVQTQPVKTTPVATTTGEAETVVNEDESFVNEYIATANSSASVGDVKDALSGLVFMAFPSVRPSKAAQRAMLGAQVFLNTSLNPVLARFDGYDLKAHVTEQLIKTASETQSKEGLVKVAFNAQLRPWFEFAIQDNGMTSAVIKALTLSNWPTEVTTSIDAATLARVNDVKAMYDVTKPAPTVVVKDTKANERSLKGVTDRLAMEEPVGQQELVQTLVFEFNKHFGQTTNPFRGANLGAARKQKAVGNLESVFAALTADSKNTPYRDGVLGDYFTDGKLNLVKTDSNVWKLAAQTVTSEFTAKRQAEESANRKALDEYDATEDWFDQPNDIEAAYKPRGSEDFQKEDLFGNFIRTDGKVIKPMVVGEVKLRVTGMLAKFSKKPKTHVFKDGAEFKAKNPALFKQAQAARKDIDLATVNAAGFAFGDNVVIFADHIHGDQHLAFVLAHEVLGHYGLRGIMPADKLNYMLDRVYKADAQVQMLADRFAMTHGVPKREATEEVLADYSAHLHNSTILKVWNAIKNFLNKLGFKFDDDLARYMVGHARRYVREGVGGSVMSANQITAALDAAKQTQEVLRFSRNVDEHTLATASLKAMAMNQREAYRNVDLTTRAAGTLADIKTRVGRALEHVQTLSNKALKSEGLNFIFNFFQDVSHHTRKLQSHYNELTKFTHMSSIGEGGPTADDIQKAGQLLAYGALHNNAKATEKQIRSMDKLYKMGNFGKFTIDKDAVAKAVNFSNLTPQDFNNGLDVVVTEYNEVGEVMEERTVKWKPDFEVSENSPIWKVFVEQRNAVNQGALDVLTSKLQGALDERTTLLDTLDNIKGERYFSAEDKAVVNTITDKYMELYTEGATIEGSRLVERKESKEKAEAFLKEVTRVMMTDLKLNDWLNPTAESDAATKVFAQDPTFDDIKAMLPQLADLRLAEQSMYKVQKIVRDAFLAENSVTNADFKARKTIMSAYVPFSRRGRLQVRMRALNAETGEPMEIKDIPLPYFKTDSSVDAQAIARDLEAAFDKLDVALPSADGTIRPKVRFVAEIAEARETAPLSESVNYEDFVRTLNSLNVNLTPSEYERITTAMNKSTMTARSNLIRTGNPGWDADVVRNVSEHLETTAHIAAKNIYNHKITRVLTDNKLWRGDRKKLTRLEAAVKNAPNPQAKQLAQQDYDRYAFMYVHMADVGIDGRDSVMVNGKPVKLLGRGERYREEAKELLAFYAAAGDIAVSTEDVLSSELGSKLKLWTVLMQLGGSVATAVVNTASFITNMLPYLSGYNPNNGFGGGFGIGNSMAALTRAFMDIKGIQSVEALNKEIADGSYKKRGLTLDEAIFLRNATEQGILQAAQTNALLGNARGGIRSNVARKGVDLWMSMFTYTEQLTRRAMALASYRLQRERMLATGVPESTFTAQADNEEFANRLATDPNLRALYQFTTDAVNNSLGDYAMYNRPTMARGNMLQYVFVYKQYIITTLQMLRHLPPSATGVFVIAILIAAGFKGLPFAEDLLDLADTLAQASGTKVGSVEMEMVKMLEEFIPGSSPYFTRGVLDALFGTTVSSRLSFGNVFPLTGMFISGSDPWREATDFLGPVWGGITGMASSAKDVTTLLAESLGLRPDVTSLETILRESPVSALRALTDALVFTTDGRITNAQGKLVDEDVTLPVILSRAMGFYPIAATRQNDIVRLSKQVADYAADIKRSYVTAAVKAKLKGDMEEYQSIMGAVRDWNADAKGTAFHIRDFGSAVNRSYKAAATGTAERYLDTAPLPIRGDTELLIEATGGM